MTRRAAVAVTVVATLLLPGCSAGGRTERESAPAPTVSADASVATAEAVERLRAGTEFIDRTSFRTDVDIASQLTTLSHHDNVNKRAVSTLSAFGRVTEIRMIDDNVYLKTGMDLPGVGDGWMSLDPSRVPAGFTLGFAPGKNDPGGSARLIDAIVTARTDGPHVVGTMDLTRVGGGNGISFRPGTNGFPDGVRSNPFRATLDADGRLVSFLIPAANGMPNASLRYSDFGADVDVARPRGAVAAPDALYPQLGLSG